MTEEIEIPDLAMPLGLPPAGTDVAAHYTAMSAVLKAEVNPENTVKIWVEAGPLFSGINAMVRSSARYFPAGSTGPDGLPVPLNTLVFKTWLWEALSLRKSVGAGNVVPALIYMSNIDQAELATLVDAEIQSSPRYAGLSAAERTQLKDDFVGGGVSLLVNSGTVLARGAVDPAPTDPLLAGYRRIDLSFRDKDGVAMSPAFYFDVFGAIGGDKVDGHPLLDLLGSPLTPASAPVEGGTRIRIKGQNFTNSSTVAVGGTPASNIRMAAGGTLLYATLPPGSEGASEVLITTTGLPDVTITPGIKYVTDLLETARAVSASFVVHLTELRDHAQFLSSSGGLDANTRKYLRLELELAHRLSFLAIDDRAATSGVSPNTPEVADIIGKNMALQTILLGEAITAIG